MIFIINILILINLLLLTTFVVYHFSFLLLYLVYKHMNLKPIARSSFRPKHKFAIIVPAHNEEMIIGRLLDSINLLRYPPEMFDVYVIADNCSDDTANIAINRGVICLTRHDNKNKGKPFALHWAFQKVDIDRYSAFTIIDADTEIDPDFLNHMDIKLNAGANVIQGYFSSMNPEETWLTSLMILPAVIKFETRYYIKDVIGISCPLMGNGMTFSHKVIKEFGWQAFSITENWEYYVQLALKDYTVEFSKLAYIYSHAVTKLSHGEVQRKRWIKGRIEVFKNYFSPLFHKSIAEFDINCIDALLELLSPSYSMLALWSFLSFGACSLLVFLNFLSPDFAIWSAVLFFLLFALLLSGLIISRAPLRVWLALPYVPLFILWKFSVILKSLLTYADKSWQKTERKI